jgi:hypothetical protein
MTVGREEIETLRLLRAFAKIKDRAKHRAIVDLVEAHAPAPRQDPDGQGKS